MSQYSLQINFKTSAKVSVLYNECEHYSKSTTTSVMVIQTIHYTHSEFVHMGMCAPNPSTHSKLLWWVIFMRLMLSTLYISDRCNICHMLSWHVMCNRIVASCLSSNEDPAIIHCTVMRRINSWIIVFLALNDSPGVIFCILDFEICTAKSLI